MAHLLVAKRIERRNEFDIYVKDALFRDGLERQRKFKTVWDSKGFDNQNGTQEVKALLGGDFMSYPKPVALMREICLLGAPEGGVVLDLFAGSGTTAQAVIETSVVDGKSRQFILVQLDERLPEDSLARGAGYRTIADLSRDRVLKAGKRIAEGTGLVADDHDLGFRALRIDTTNMAPVLLTPEETDQKMLSGLRESVKADRSGDDLLFQVLLDWGLDLTVPITVDEVEGQDIFVVERNALLACFQSDPNRRLVAADGVSENG